MAGLPTHTNPLYLKRAKLFRDAIRFDSPERVPYLANYWTWKFFDAGYTIEEGARDYDKIKDANKQFLEKYPVDAIINAGFRNPLRVSDSIGATGYASSEDSELFVTDSSLIEAEDYDLVAEDFFKAIWTRAVPKRCSSLIAQGPEAMAAAAKEYAIYDAQANENVRMVEDDYGVCMTGRWALSGWEVIFNCLRGIKGTSKDIRRKPEQLKAAIKTVDATIFNPSVAALAATPDGPDETLPFDFTSAWLGHTILSPKQFGEFYWPTMEYLFDTCVEKDKTVYIFSEGNWLYLADFLKKYPKGHIAMHVELDDIYEVREKVPNVCLVGGLDSQVMSNGTPEECVAMAKRAIEVLGSGDGGFILSENKMMSYACDSKPENVKAVAEFVQNQ